jgi:hypothetical protein
MEHIFIVTHVITPSSASIKGMWQSDEHEHAYTTFNMIIFSKFLAITILEQCSLSFSICTCCIYENKKKTNIKDTFRT